MVSGSFSKTWILLIIVLLLVGSARSIFFFSLYSKDPTRIFAPDSASYTNTARAFLQTGHFSVHPETPEYPQIIRTPGYPFFIAGVFFLCGDHYPALILAQIMLSVGTLAITYLIAQKLWNSTIALLSSLFLALDMLSCISSQQVLTETLFTFTLTVSTFVGITILNKRILCVSRIMLYGLLLAFATLIRPILYYAMIPLSVLLVLTWRIHFKWDRKKTLLSLLLLFTPWLIFVGGWQVRNYVTVGSAEFSHIQGVNLLFYRGAAIVAQRDGIGFEKARQKLGYQDYLTLPQGSKLAQLNARWKREGLHLIIQHPVLFLTSQIRGVLVMMLGTGEALLLEYIGYKGETAGPVKDFVRLPLHAFVQKWLIEHPGLFMLFSMTQVHLLTLYLGVLYSAGFLVYRSMMGKNSEHESPGAHMLIWMVILYIIFVSAGPEAYSRFRIPLMPLLSLYAGHGLVQCLKMIYMRRYR